MRSSVSVILSSPPPDTTMSYPDYQAHPHQHRSLLVLVAPLGSRVKSKSFQQLYERISRVSHLKVNDSGGAQRPVWVSYRRDYPVENNDWGDFQTHRRLLAIITIGLDLILAGLDLILAGLDLIFPGLDLIFPGLDLILAGLDLIFPGLDLILSGLDLILSGLDLIMSCLNLILSGLDLTLPGLDPILPGLNLILSGLDLILSGLDLIFDRSGPYLVILDLLNDAYSFGQVASQSDLNEVCKQHESLKVKYASTIYDSRCIILGLNSDGSVHNENANDTVADAHLDLKSSRGKGPSDTTEVCPDGGVVFMHGDRDSGVYDNLPSEDRASADGDAPHRTPINGHMLAVEKKRCDSSSQSDSGQSSGVKTNLSSSSSDSGSESAVDGCCVTDTETSNHSSGTLTGGAQINIDPTSDSLHDNNSSSSESSLNSTLNITTTDNLINGNTLHNTDSIKGFNNLNNSTSTPGSGTRAILQPPSYFKTRAMFYPTADHALNIETTLHEFISSLFWVLESKRLDKSQEKLDRPPLLCAPFERKDMVGLDMNSGASRKRCVGRLKKQLGDLCLQVGLVGEAAQHYSQAADILRASNDWLWLAGCLEGSCAASAVQLYPDLGRGASCLQRNSSLGVGPTSVKHRQTNSLPSNSLPTGLTPTAAKHLSKHCLSPDNLINKYREAIVHYSKYRNAGVVETEASIKAVYVLIEQRRYLLAAEFLSNVVFINLQLSDEEKISRFRALAELYQELGMMRKAGFFRRVAAMRCAVAQSQRTHDWPQCYKLLLNTLPGYRLSLDPLHCIQMGGWGALQVQLIQEVVGTSRRMGSLDACCRHQAFLLAALLHHLTSAQRQEAALMLHTLTQQASSSATGSGGVVGAVVAAAGQQSTAPVAPHNLLPPVNLLSIPFCRSVKVQAPKTGHQLKKRLKAISDEPTGPFIFSPFSSLTHTAAKPSNTFDFQWVEGDVCEVILQLDNILSLPLQLTNIRLLTEGVCRFESWSSSVVVESESSCSVTLRGQPTTPGELKITGYSLTALGVTSTCRFKHMNHLRAPYYLMQVVPALPLLQVESDNNTSGPSSSPGGSSKGGGLSVEGGVGGAKIRGSLMAGETQQLRLTLHNISPQPVAAVAVVVKSKMDSGERDKVFKVDEVSLERQLPMRGNSSTHLVLSLYGLCDLLAIPLTDDRHDGDRSSAGGSVAPSSLPCSSLQSISRGSQRPQTPVGGGRSSSGSMLSGKSGASGRSQRSSQASTGSTRSKEVACPSVKSGGVGSSFVEGEVELWYRGEGVEHWRTCLLCVRLQVTPTLQVVSWDVLPGDAPQQCYLVLDLLNRSCSEMVLTYTTDGRSILVQAGDSCRVPVPVTRCPRNPALQVCFLCGSRCVSSAAPGVFPLRLQVCFLCGSRCVSSAALGVFPLRLQNGERSVSEALGEHVASQVRLEWVLSPSELSCSASLPHLHFPLHTHHLMLLAPITWDVSVNGTSVSVGGECNSCVGENVSVEISITNSSDGDLPPLRLSCSTLQDHQNGNTNYRTEGVVAPAGAMVALLPQLGAGESKSTRVNLVFFTGGSYKLELRCCPVVPTSVPTTFTGGPASLTSTSLAAPNSSISNIAGQPPLLHQQSSQLSQHSAYPQSSSVPPSEVWMFAPPIELTISH
ncbi:TRAPP II complex Trs120 [Trinorchestia longiramus]|nr:TRAPP II complex Trs120 [Trinorchestia longiramus]